MADNKHIQSLSSKTSEEKFDEKMKDLALKEKEQEAQMAAYAAGLSYISLVGKPVPPGPLSLIPEEDALRLQITCFAENAEEMRIAAVDPSSGELKKYIAELEKAQNRTVQLFLMSESSFLHVQKLYRQLPKITESQGGVQITQADIDRYGDDFSDIRTINDQLKGVTLTEIITVFVAIALKTNASDIHVEAEEKDVKVRLRIDGILHDIASLTPDTWPRIISRVKLLAGLKINVSDRPQDGRFTIYLEIDKVDVRVSTLPTAYGESIVMRLLKSSAAGLQFEQLGLSPYSHGILKKEIDKPNGMIITTGPTGSGKTTTLYAVLNYLNSEDVKIITLEDPVEYKLNGVNQSQIDPSKGYSFAAGLRSILRQDPDIVMVGEIRDLETAEIALNAALTGHLVISTIHTNSAAGAIPRFLAMGVKDFLLAPALNAVIGQRLVRRLCAECKQHATLPADVVERIAQTLSTLPAQAKLSIDLSTAVFWGPKGCEACHGLGYRGRIGMYEIMIMNKEIEENIHSGAVSEYVIQEIAVKNGMITMVQDGLLRALEGVTSVDEVFEAAE